MDFRGTGLCFLELDGTGVKKIFLPDGVQRLSLSGVPDPELQIAGPLDRELDIELSLDSSGFEDWGTAMAGLRSAGCVSPELGSWIWTRWLVFSVRSPCCPFREGRDFW